MWQRELSGRDGPCVLQVLPRLDRDDVIETVLDLTRAIGRQGWRTVIASPGGPLAREAHAAGAALEVVPLDERGPLAGWRSIARLVAAGKRHGVRVVHAHAPTSLPAAGAAAGRLGVGLLRTVHRPEDWRTAGRRRLGRREGIVAQGDRLIAVSGHLARQLETMPGGDPGRMRTIPPGIDLVELDPDRVRGHRVAALAERWNLGAESRVLLLPGPLAAGYGQDLLLEAVARLRRPGLLILFLGAERRGSGYLTTLRSTMRRLGVEDQVRFGNDCPDVPAAMQLADLIVLPATEPLPAARLVVAAQAMGKPVIVSDVGALPELMMPDSSGWLVPAGDVAELAAALERVLTLDDSAREHLRHRAREFARAAYSLEHMAARTIELYEELARSRSVEALPRASPDVVEPAAD